MKDPIIPIGKYNLIIWLYARFQASNATIFLKKYHIRPKFIFALTIQAFSLAIPLVGSAFSGVLFGNDPKIVMYYLQDAPAVFGVGLIGLPFMVLFLIYFRNKLNSVIKTSMDNGIITIEPNDLNLLSSRYTKLFNSKHLLWLIPIAFCMSFFGIYEFFIQKKTPWFLIITGGGTVIFNAIGLYYFLLITLLFYCLGALSIYIILSFGFIRKLSNTAKISIQPLHPDNCGGLSGIASLGLMMVWPIVVGGFQLALTFYSNLVINKINITPAQLFGVAFYLFMASFAFFYPLSFFRKSLIKEKNDILSKLNKTFYCQFKTAHQGNTLEDWQHLNEIVGIYNLAKKLPTLPFNFAMIRKLTALILSPISGFILPYLKDNFLQPYILQIKNIIF